jgi:tetratricopeptide (TPR) repeat protein
VAAAPVMPSYSRTAVRRLLRVSEAQLRSWERQKLVPPSADYGFRDLVALRTLAELRKNHVAPQRIKLAIHALRRSLDGVENPLKELKMYAVGKKIRVELEGHAMEAESGQLLLDFSHGELTRLLEFRAKKEDVRKQKSGKQEAAYWFERGLEMEKDSAPLADVITAYKRAIELDPHTAGAHVNLGTIYFNARKWSEAEYHYKQALAADPNYSLAHFDLGNLYDERGNQALAAEHYIQALRITPNYADAHYNLALVYQGSGQTMKAVHHWMTYLKLDPISQWSSIARRELAKLRDATLLQGSRGKG